MDSKYPRAPASSPSSPQLERAIAGQRGNWCDQSKQQRTRRSHIYAPHSHRRRVKVALPRRASTHASGSASAVAQAIQLVADMQSPAPTHQGHSRWPP
jgi:hypothetical protein